MVYDSITLVDICYHLRVLAQTFWILNVNILYVLYVQQFVVVD